MTKEEAVWLLEFLHRMQIKAQMLPDVGDGSSMSQEWVIVIK